MDIATLIADITSNCETDRITNYNYEGIYIYHANVRKSTSYTNLIHLDGLGRNQCN